MDIKTKRNLGIATIVSLLTLCLITIAPVSAVEPGCEVGGVVIDHAPSYCSPSVTTSTDTAAPSDTKSAGIGTLNSGNQASSSNKTCGDNSTSVQTSIDFGCKGQGNGVNDLLLAVVRFLSAGVGIVIVGSIVFAGIQYTTAQGDPQATAAAMRRIRAAGGALLFYLFAYALLNYLVPGGLLFK